MTRAGVLGLQPGVKLDWRVLADRPVDDDRLRPGREMVGEVVPGVQRRHKRERPLGRIAIGLVIDVVEDQPVQIEREKSSDRRVGDFLGLVPVGREAPGG